MKTIFISGCFDGVLHSGHCYILSIAKELANQHNAQLVVALNSDNYLRQNKGPTRPITKLKERKKQIELLKLADQIIDFEDNKELFELISFYRPIKIVVGEDYADLNKVVGYPQCQTWGGSVYVVSKLRDKDGEIISTTKILKGKV